jgi:hypothetical protein
MIFKNPPHLKANKLLTHLIQLHNKENIYIACSCKKFILEQSFFVHNHLFWKCLHLEIFLRRIQNHHYYYFLIKKQKNNLHLKVKHQSLAMIFWDKVCHFHRQRETFEKIMGFSCVNFNFFFFFLGLNHHNFNITKWKKKMFMKDPLPWPKKRKKGWEHGFSFNLVI